VDVENVGRIVVRADGEYRGKDGAKVALKPDLTRLHRFDDKGRALR
jgi:multiple sugar transport system ATP-binding protein